MKVVFFMQDTGAIYGAERATLDLAWGLRSTGVDPVFYLIEEQRLSQTKSDLVGAIQREGFPYRSFPVSGRISPSLLQAIRKAWREDAGDVLHVIGYKANLHAFLSGIRPRVATVHGWLFRADRKERMYDAIDRWCLLRCDRVICLSTHYQELLLRCGVAENRVVRIPSGLREIPSTGQLPERYPAKGALVFGMMGRFSEEKNHRMFLEAILAIHADYPEARFRIAGTGHLEPQLWRWIDAWGLGDVVDVQGYVSAGDFMASIDVYVMCSTMENLPYSILEAMAWARPVVATRVGGIPDLVEDGQTGWLVAADDSSGLAKAMEACAGDPAESLHRGRRGRERLEQAFTLEASVAAHRSLYSMLA
ncbi:MAG TPA: glycosyltransferase family 4 protein [Kiritimatiellia bacterium]|nr:glycosyltransferase family 4 protein [Kiritimatiellia bacterium]